MYEAYVPAHITGFFKVHISEDPLFTGSIGAGICLDLGLKTFVKVERGNNMKLFFNGSEVDSKIIKVILNKMGINDEISIIARQESPFSMGYGYGMSGASILGLALAINKALGEPYKKEDIGRIAHIIEVERKTGLGDVIAQMIGGFELRTKPGAPGLGKIKRLPHPKELLVITTPVKMIKTCDLLINLHKINEIGETCYREFQRNPNIENFMKISKSFWEKLEIINQDIIKVLKIYENYGIELVSFKKGIVYGIVRNEDFPLESGVYEKNGIKLIVSRISNRGAH